MKQPLWAIAIAIGLLTLLLFACFTQIDLIEPHARTSDVTTLAPVLAVQHPLTENASIHLTATVGTDPASCGTQSNIEAEIGTRVYFCYTVQNTGNVTFTNHTVSDDLAGTIWDNQSRRLVPGLTIRTRPSPVGADSSITVEHSFVNNVHWLATGSVTATADAATIVRAVGTFGVSLTADKAPGCTSKTSATAQVGDRVYYCITIQNSTNLTLTRHIISLPIIRFSTALTYFLPPAAQLVITDGLLPRLDINNASFAHIITGPVTSAAKVTSFSASGDKFVGTGTSSIVTRKVSITLDKAISTNDDKACPIGTTVAPVTSDMPIYYCLRITNTGEVTLTEHTFSEPTTGVGGTFTYNLAPGKSVILTQAGLVASKGVTITYAQTPILGPFYQAVTSTHALNLVSTNTEGFHTTAVATTTFNLAQAGIEYILNATTARNACINSDFLLSAGNPYYFCMSIKNTGAVPLTSHAFTFAIGPPNKSGKPYVYEAKGAFTYPLPPGGTMEVTNAFLATVGLPALMGPYTATIPLAVATRIVNTSIFTASNPTVKYQIVVRATNDTLKFNMPATATPTFTPVPVASATFTPIPGATPTPSQTAPPTPVTPTPTPIVISPLVVTPTPDLRVRSVTAPQGTAVAQSPLATPVGQSPLATPTLLVDPAVAGATMTADADLTATAIATFFTPTPTFTETPFPTFTPTETASPSPTPTATATQRPIAQPTATMVADNSLVFGTAFERILTAAGWIWFLVGVLVFFAAAGVVVGLGFRQREQQRYTLYDGVEPPLASPLPSTPPPAKPAEEDDHWPSSLP